MSFSNLKKLKSAFSIKFVLKFVSFQFFFGKVFQVNWSITLLGVEFFFWNIMTIGIMWKYLGNLSIFTYPAGWLGSLERQTLSFSRLLASGNGRSNPAGDVYMIANAPAIRELIDSPKLMAWEFCIWIGMRWAQVRTHSWGGGSCEMAILWHSIPLSVGLTVKYFPISIIFWI